MQGEGVGEGVAIVEGAESGLPGSSHEEAGVPWAAGRAVHVAMVAWVSFTAPDDARCDVKRGQAGIPQVAGQQVTTLNIRSSTHAHHHRLCRTVFRLAYKILFRVISYLFLFVVFCFFTFSLVFFYSNLVKAYNTFIFFIVFKRKNEFCLFNLLI